MGQISSKMREVLGMVKEDARIPVILKLTEFGAEPISQMEGLGMKVDEQFRMTKMVSGTIRAGDVQSLADLPTVETVFYDEPLAVAKIPFFRIAEQDSGLIPVSDDYTVGALGAPRVWQQFGYEGKGVKVAVLDTGGAHPMFQENVEDTFSVVPEESVNEGNHPHGCLAGDTKVTVSFCGLRTLEELWDKVDVPAVNQQGGEVKWLESEENTVSLNGVTLIKALYRTRADEKVVINTKYGKVESTTWHKFFVARPNANKHTGKKINDWSKGYTVEEVEARDLRRGDVLVASTFKGQTWHRNIDPSFAYLHGLITGDGTIIYRPRRSEVRIYDKNTEFLERLADVVRAKAPSPYIRKVSKKENGYELGFYGKDIVTDLISTGIEDILKDLESFRAWIAGFFDAEGYFSDARVNKGIEAVISNTNLELLQYLQDALRNAGIYFRIDSGGVSKGSKSYHLTTPDVDLFLEFIKPYSLSKKIPHGFHKIPRRRSYNHKIKRGKDLLVQIDSVHTEECDEWFYDLSTDEGNYIANGIAVHNSWCQGCIAGTPYSGVMEGQSFDLVGMAPDADLITGKVLSDDGSGKTSYVLKGMEKAYDMGADIISMSLGSPISEAGNSPDSQMVEELAKEGVLCSVAAGNQYVNGSIGSPGDSRGALTVASVSYAMPARNMVSTFSSKGPTIDMRLKPDIAAFGGNVVPEMNELLVSAGQHGELDAMAGTSMATPHTSGALALLVQAGMPTDVETAEYSLGQTAKKLTPVPKDINRGWGQLNVFNAVNEAWWESPSSRTFARFTQFSKEATSPFRAVATPFAKKAIQALGIETTPKLAVIRQTIGE